MSRILLAALAGALFGFGLAVSGMTNPDKVLNFLDLAGRWDPSLAMVMGGALAITIPGYAWFTHRGVGVGGVELPLQSTTRVDPRLLAGSALFGIGWGIAGYCPGPALANLANSTLEPVVFVIALLAGSQLARIVSPPA